MEIEGKGGGGGGGGGAAGLSSGSPLPSPPSSTVPTEDAMEDADKAASWVAVEAGGSTVTVVAGRLPRGELAKSGRLDAPVDEGQSNAGMVNGRVEEEVG